MASLKSPSGATRTAHTGIATSDATDNAMLEKLVTKHRAAGHDEPERQGLLEAAMRHPRGMKDHGHGL